MADMNCNSLKVAFAGTPEFAAVALDALLDSPHQVVGVLTQPDRPAGRGRKLLPSAVKSRAADSGVSVLQPASLRDEQAQSELLALGADVLVVAAYGLILPQTVLDMPALGCLNIHGSLLPRWRGAAPIHRAVLAGDERTGVCIMQMDAGLDTGAVLLEKSLAIDPDETAAQLHDRLAELGAAALLEALPARCDGSLKAVAQPSSGVCYAEKLTKSEAKLNFNTPSLELHRRIRAFNPWPVAEAQLCGERVRIWKSRLVVERESDAAASAAIDSSASLAADATPGMIVATANNALRVRSADGMIDLLTLQWPGKKAQDAATFFQGRNLLGECFE